MFLGSNGMRTKGDQVHTYHVATSHLLCQSTERVENDIVTLSDGNCAVSKALEIVPKEVLLDEQVIVTAKLFSTTSVHFPETCDILTDL